MSAFPEKRQRGREKATSSRPSFLGCYLTGNPQEINILKISCIPCKQSGHSLVRYPMNFEFQKCLPQKYKKKIPYMNSRTHWSARRGEIPQLLHSRCVKGDTSDIWGRAPGTPSPWNGTPVLSSCPQLSFRLTARLSAFDFLAS